MSRTAQVSVVMAVYGGAEKLGRSIESVLDQSGVDLEFVIVNDGSGPEVHRILESYAKADNRIQLVHQQNSGLTRSLITGCDIASFEYLARQDAGDRYLPDKLRRQVETLEENPAATMVTCGTRFTGPGEEFLFEISQTSAEAKRGLSSLSIESIRGPSHHCSVMFLRDAYQAVGGYRPEFRVAQDMDLWLRLTEQGDVVSMPDVLLEAEFAPNTISGNSRLLQIEMGKILIACAIRRRRGEDETPLLKAAEILKPRFEQWPHRQLAESNYFIARLLQKNRDRRCLEYFGASLRADPYQVKARLASLQARISSLGWGSGDSRSSTQP